MNLIHGKVRSGQFRPARSAGPITLPPGFGDLAEDRAITLGIRPENISLTDPQTPGAIPARVDVVELTGPEKLVMARIGEDRLTASLAPTTGIEAGQTCHLAFDPLSLVIFDTANGQRLDPQTRR